MIVVTGGAGFIGSGIVARLNERGCDDLVIVDHMVDGDGKERNLATKKFRDYYDKAVFLSMVTARRFPGDVEAVIHMGACSSTTGTDARYYDENNFQYSCRLAEWCLERGIRFIYASSAATYGDGEQGYSDDHTMVPLLRPLNLYGESKQRFDEWALAEGRIERMVGLKFFNVFGPNEYHKGDMRSVVHKAYPRVVREGRIQLFKSYHPDYADGEQRRDFVYVKDAVDMVLHFLDHPRLAGIYNVGTGQARSWNDLARALFAAVGKPPVIEYIDMPEHLRPRYQYFTQAVMDKMTRCGYDRPCWTLEASVADYAGYLQSGRHW